MRKLVALAIVVALAVLAVVIGDRVALRRTESDISSRIEKQMPGSHATVTVSSSPFLVNLAVSGTIREVHAHVTGATDDNLHLDAIDLTIHNLRISRTSVLDGSPRLVGLSDATITASVSVAEVLRAAGYGALARLGPLVSGVTASVKLGSGQVEISLGPYAFSFSYSSLVPCVGSARVNSGEVILTCKTNTLPAALRAAAA